MVLQQVLRDFVHEKNLKPPVFLLTGIFVTKVQRKETNKNTVTNLNIFHFAHSELLSPGKRRCLGVPKSAGHST
jgi:hypothetical protein